MKSDQEPDATAAEPEDNISRSKRILSLVDDYVLRINSRANQTQEKIVLRTMRSASPA